MPDFLSVRFQGTAPRKTFWLNVLSTFLLGGLCGLGLMFGMAALLGESLAFALVVLLVSGACLVALSLSGFAVGSQRCRDLGHSGWLVLVYFVPVVAILFWLYLGLAPGETRASEDANA